MSEADTGTNLAFIEPVYSVNSTAADQANPSASDSPDEKQSCSTESMLTQQTQDFKATQEQLRYLSQELEASHQTAQRQQILIETLTKHLESSQARLAQMERECFLAQQRYNEQSHQLVQTENACRELHTRLTRQQRQTLQFKLALEKCLEVPAPIYKFQADTTKSPSADPFPPVTTSPLDDFKNAPYSCTLFLSQAPPIQPWSGQLKSLTNELESAWDKEAGNLLPPGAPLPLSDPPPAESPPTTDLEELHALEQDLVSLLEAVEEPVTGNSVKDTTVVPSPDTPQFSRDDPGVAPTESPQQETSCIPTSNWPSPVIYPLRPPKGRKSLAAIELPTFAPISLSRVAEG